MVKSPKVQQKTCPHPVKCCGNTVLRLDVDDATGFQMFRVGIGAVIMSNVFLSTSLITLAQRSIGCTDDNSVCEGEIYGFRPSSLITIIGTISGLMSAFLLPIIGAIVDYTKHRKLLGKIVATLLITVQAIQVGTVQATWFPMAILQAINGFFYQALALVMYAYLPEIQRIVGQEKMLSYTSRFFMWMFSTQAIYLFTVVGLSVTINADDVLTGQLGQAIDVVVSGSCFAMGFYFFSEKESRRVLPQGNSLLLAGFKQVFISSKQIVQQYPSTLTLYFLGVLFGEAAIGALTTVSVTFLVELGLSGTTTGIVVMVLLVSTLPGSAFATYFMKKVKSPITSIKWCSIIFIFVNFISFFLLAHPDNDHLVWVFAVLWGFLLGWYYPSEVSIYSSMMPTGQEAELAGIYLYCSQVLAWLPPLLFTIFNENPNIHLSWAGVQLNIFIFISLIFYHLMPPWSQCIELTNGNKIQTKNAPNSGVIEEKDGGGFKEEWNIV